MVVSKAHPVKSFFVSSAISHVYPFVLTHSYSQFILLVYYTILYFNQVFIFFFHSFIHSIHWFNLLFHSFIYLFFLKYPYLLKWPIRNSGRVCYLCGLRYYLRRECLIVRSIVDETFIVETAVQRSCSIHIFNFVINVLVSVKISVTIQFLGWWYKWPYLHTGLLKWFWK